MAARSGWGRWATRTPLTGNFQFPMELNCKSRESVTVCCLPGRGESYCSRLRKTRPSFPKQNSNQGSRCVEDGFRTLSCKSGHLHLPFLPAGVTLGKSLPLSGPQFLRLGKEVLGVVMPGALSSSEMLAFCNKVGCGKI